MHYDEIFNEGDLPKKYVAFSPCYRKEVGTGGQDIRGILRVHQCGDMSFPAAETIDIETWIPSQNLYRETHSISTTTDFQARRLKTRF